MTWLRPTDFGPAADDETAIVQAAFDSPDPVELDRTYHVSTIIATQSKPVIGLNKRNSGLTKIAGTAGPVLTHGNHPVLWAKFANFCIDGNMAACPDGTDGVGVPDTSWQPEIGAQFGECVWEDLYVENCRRFGMYIGNSSAGGVFMSHYNRLVIANNGHSGARFDGHSESFFTDLQVSNHPFGGILMNAGASNKISRPIIEGLYAGTPITGGALLLASNVQRLTVTGGTLAGGATQVILNSSYACTLDVAEYVQCGSQGWHLDAAYVPGSFDLIRVVDDNPAAPWLGGHKIRLDGRVLWQDGFCVAPRHWLAIEGHGSGYLVSGAATLPTAATAEPVSPGPAVWRPF